MFPVFALIFLIVPLVEIYILIQVGQVIGALWTMFFVVFTAVLGVHLLKQQGIATLSRAQHKMQQGEMPAGEMLEGVGLLLAGAFLLTPGFFTDAFGFLLLFPPTRVLLLHSLRRRFEASGHFHVYSDSSQDPSRGPESSRPNKVIDGVSYRKDDDAS
jgi:UPF0716 protein FxsA